MLNLPVSLRCAVVSAVMLCLGPLVAIAQAPNDLFFPSLKYDSIIVSQYNDGVWQPNETVTPAWNGIRLDSAIVQYIASCRQDRTHYAYRNDTTLDRAVTWMKLQGGDNVWQLDSFWCDEGQRVIDMVSYNYYGLGTSRTNFTYGAAGIDSSSRWWKEDTGWVLRESWVYRYDGGGRLCEAQSGRVLKRYFYGSSGALQTIISTLRTGNDETPTLMWEYQNSRVVHPFLLTGTLDQPLIGLVGDTCRALLRLTNRSAEPVQLTSVAVSDFRFKLEPGTVPVSLAQDSSVAIPIQFYSVTRGTYPAVVRIVDKEGQSIGIEVSARAKAAHLRVLADTVRFTDVPVGEVSTESVVIINDGDGPIDIDSICPSSLKFTLYGFDPQRIQEGGALGVTIDYLSDWSSFDTAVLELHVHGILGKQDKRIYLEASAGKRNSVSEFTETRSVQVYPNPCRSALSIQSSKAFARYAVIDLQGNVVQCGGYVSPIIVDNLPTGQYLLKLESDEANSETRRFIRMP